MKFDPFDNVDSKYGAPMGRRSAPAMPEGELAAQHQEGGDGYDKGGAYWGLPSNVYAVWEVGHGPATVQYVRACSCGEAIDKVRGYELDAFTRAYIEAMYFTDGQGIDDDEFDGDTLLSDEAYRRIKEDCEQFQTEAFYLLAQAYSHDGYDRAQAGHDFWLTRNEYGAGFWARRLGLVGDELTKVAGSFGECDPYKGDDGLVYLE